MATFIEVKSKTFYDVISNLINDQEDSDKLFNLSRINYLWLCYGHNKQH